MKELLILALAVMIPAVAPAQTAQELSGVVADETGGVIHDAKVTLIESTTGALREASSDRSGRFRFEEIPPGEHVLRVQAPGFQPFELRLSLAERLADPLTVKLKVAFEEQVTVRGSVQEERLAFDQNADSVRIDDDLLRSLPLPAGAESLVNFIGQFVSPAAQGTDELSVLVDGLETRRVQVPTWSIRRVYINKDPYSAEYRRPGKARVEILTQDGSRKHYHGGGGFTLRNSFWDARNPLADVKPDRDRRFGEGSFSGPLLGKWGTLFFSGERFVETKSAVVNAVTPEGPVVQNIPTDEEESTFLARWDMRAKAQRLRLTARYEREEGLDRNEGVGGIRLPERVRDGESAADTFQLSVRAIPSLDFLNDVRFSVERAHGLKGRAADRPAVVVLGAFEGGPSQDFEEDRENVVELQDTATSFFGPHTLRFGGRIRRKSVTGLDATNFAGTFEFSSLEAFEAGNPFVFHINRGDPRLSFTMVEADAFVQDQMKLGTDLNLMVGLRYEWQSHINDRNNFAPRFGIAYSPRWLTKTVLRAGAGIFYERLSSSLIERTFLLDGLRVQEMVISEPSYPDPFAGGSAVPLPPPSIIRLSPDARTPHLLQTSLAVEREIWPRAQLAVEYSFLRGFHLFRSRNVNAPLPGTGVRPDPGFLNVIEVETTALLRSHILTASLRGRIGRHIKANATYTLSKAVNDTAGAEPGARVSFNLPADNYNLAAELGRADFDRRHQFAFAGAVELPALVRLGAILGLASGAPFDITTGFDDNGDTMATDRPPGIRRNEGQGTGLARLDLRITKLVLLPHALGDPKEESELEINLDAFNVLNRANFSEFVGVRTSPLFGQPVRARDARTLQISIRFSF